MCMESEVYVCMYVLDGGIPKDLFVSSAPLSLKSHVTLGDLLMSINRFHCVSSVAMPTVWFL